jgi:hypothetical protein
MMYKVKDHADLARDPHNNSIINTNTLEHQKYLTRRAAKEEGNKKVESIEKDVANIKDDLDEIKFLLKKLLSDSQ